MELEKGSILFVTAMSEVFLVEFANLVVMV